MLKFSPTSQENSKCHFVKKSSPTERKVAHDCQKLDKNHPSFNSLCHQNFYHKLLKNEANLEVELPALSTEGFDGKNLQVNLKSTAHFLIHSVTEWVRLKKFNRVKHL